MTFFSVIIPTCNRSDLLSKCLNRLGSIVQANIEECEVIVSDDSKNNVAQQLIKKEFEWVKWVEGPKRGPAANRNYGAKNAKGEWLVFIDDDCLPDKELLQQYLHAIQTNPLALAFEGAILPDNWEMLKKDMAECPVNIEGGCFWSANICINKTLFDQVSGFDENYVIAAQEDQQLKIDIEKFTGTTIPFLRDAKVVHPVRFPSIKKKISDIPVASKNFCFYAYRNKQDLGYSSFYTFLKNQIFTHIRFSFHQLKKRKIKNFFVAVTWLCFGVPLNMFNYLLLMYTKTPK